MQYKTVDIGQGPLNVGDFRRVRPHRFDERPVSRIRGSLLDPTPQQVNFLFGQRIAVVGWRHSHVFVVGRHAPHQLALVGVTGHDGQLTTVRPARGRTAIIQLQPRLPVLLIATMTRKTFSAQQRTHVTVEIDLPGWRVRQGGAGRGDHGEKNQPVSKT